MPSVPMLAAALFGQDDILSAMDKANSRLRPPVPLPVTRTVVSPLEITQTLRARGANQLPRVVEPLGPAILASPVIASSMTSAR